MHWDCIFSCFEPSARLGAKTGSYAEILIGEIIPKPHAAGKSILILLPYDFDPEFLIITGASRYVKVKVVAAADMLNGLPLLNLHDTVRRYSFAVAMTLTEMADRGDTFGHIEFGDRDGYFIIKQRRHGRFACGAISVRISSPRFLSNLDNGLKLVDYDLDARRVVHEEMLCLRNCDVIIYSAHQMLKRLSAIVAADVDLLAKAIRIPSPIDLSWARDRRVVRSIDYADNATLQALLADGNKIKIVYHGSLEPRSGIYDFINTLCSSSVIQSCLLRDSIYIAIIGADVNISPTETASGRIRNMADLSPIKSRIIHFDPILSEDFTEDLCCNAHGFIFPCGLEYEPAACARILALGAPMLISEAGCLPEITEGFPNVHAYDPLSAAADVAILSFLTRAKAQIVRSAAAAERAAEVNASVTEAYLWAADTHGSRESGKSFPQPPLTASFVVPHYMSVDYIGSCITSIKQCRQEGDEIIVVDDGSTQAEVKRLKEICDSEKVTLLLHEKNEGPSRARNSGAAAASRDLIQFIDADDLLYADGVAACRLALEHNPEIDMVSGISKVFGRKENYWVPMDSTADVFETNFSHSATMIRRKAFKEVGGYQPGMKFHFEDWEFHVRFVAAGKVAEVVNAVALGYRNRSGSRSDRNVELEEFSRLQVIEQGACLSQRQVVGPTRVSDFFVERAGIYFLNWQRAARRVHELRTALDGQEPPSHSTILRLQAQLDAERERHAPFLEVSRALSLENAFLTSSQGPGLAKAVKATHLKLSTQSLDEHLELLRSVTKFDPEWYVMNNPDLRRALLPPSDAYEHYQVHGWKEGRDPDPFVNGTDLQRMMERFVGSELQVNPYILYSLLKDWVSLPLHDQDQREDVAPAPVSRPTCEPETAPQQEAAEGPVSDDTAPG